MKRKILSVLLALVLACSFSLVTAVPVAAEVATLNVHPLQLDTKNANSTAEWSTTPVKNGSYSAHLDTEIVAAGDEARVVISLPAGTTLANIQTISWWVFTVAGYPPHVDIVLDVDGDKEVDPEDMLTAEMAYNNAQGKELDEGLTPTIDSWLKTFELTAGDGYGEINDSTMLWVTKMGAGNDDAPWGTLAEWKAGVVANDPGDDGLVAGIIDDTTPVLRLEIEVDNWVVNSEAYIDDIEINGTTYYGLIQDAIDSASGESPFIYVAAGTYAEAVFVDKSLTLNGAKPGVDARTRDTSSGESIVDGSGLELDAGIGAFNIADGVSNVIIDGFEICNWPASSNPGNGSAVMAYSYGGATQGLSQITIQNNYMHDLGWNGVLVWSNNNVVQDGFIIQFNLIEEAPYAGIELTNVTNSQVLNNKVVAPTVLAPDPGDAGVGIEIAVRAQPGFAISASNVLVEGNEISGVFPEDSRAAINILSRTYASDSNATLTGVTVKGNTVSANVIVGILAVAESRNDGPATISNLQIVDDNIVSNFTKTGIVVKDVSSIQIEGNIISSPDNSKAATNGIQVGYLDEFSVPASTGTTGTVKGNQVSGCSWGGYDPEIHTYEDEYTASGILVIDTKSALEISGNEVQSCDVGMDIEAGPLTFMENNDVHDNSYGFVLWNADSPINFNNIYNNALCGVYRTYDLTGILDATNNWWGNASGPRGVGAGAGDVISDNVDYSPWCTDSGYTEISHIQVEAVGVYVFNTIQAAINAANDGDTINVAAGTYSESQEVASAGIIIDRSLTLEGANAGVPATEVRGPESIINAQLTDYGVFIIGATTTATLDGFTVRNYEVIGILAGAFSPPEEDPFVVHILNNVVEAPSLLVDAHNNNIQVGDGTTGTIIGNEVSGALLVDPDWSGSGIIVAGSSDVLVSYNYVHDCEGGIQICGYTPEYRDAPAEDNIIENNLVENCEAGISVQGNSIGTIIRYNNVLNNDDGIESMAYDASWDHSTPSGTQVHYNNIVGNTNYGVQSVVYGSNTGTVLAEEIDALYNWWGTAIKSQIVDLVSSNVDYSLWLDAPYPDGDPTSLDVTTISLVEGWNLISLPLIPEDPTILTVLGGVDVDKVAGYSPFQDWKLYDPDGSSDLSNMNDGWGYWVDMGTTTATLTVSGYEVCAQVPAVPPEYHLDEGWNLIGFKSLTNIAAGTYLDELEPVMRAMYGYDTTSDVYTVILTITELVPGNGYWLAVSEAGTIYP